MFYVRLELSKLANKWVLARSNPLIVWNSVNLKETRVGFGRLAVSIRVRPGSPRTDVLGHSQPSLRDLSRPECTPRTNVLD